MVHDNLAAAADRLDAMADVAAITRRATLRCVLQLAEQCPPGAQVDAQALAGMLALVLGDSA